MNGSCEVLLLCWKPARLEGAAWLHRGIRAIEIARDRGVYPKEGSRTGPVSHLPGGSCSRIYMRARQ